MIKEFCAENLTYVEAAIKAGANRIELCDNLAVGGTTPSYGVIEAVCQLAKQHDVPIMTMIRPRGGDFCYSQAELGIMRRDIVMAKEAGTDGLVFGCLTPEGKVDKEAMEYLLAVVGAEEVVFHMAFDAIPQNDQLETMDWLSQQGVARILTHGGPANTSIEENVTWLKTLCQHAQGKIEILIGGGVTADTAERLAISVGTNQVHGTKIVNF